MPSLVVWETNSQQRKLLAKSKALLRQNQLRNVTKSPFVSPESALAIEARMAWNSTLRGAII
jgi:hypothetical protein